MESFIVRLYRQPTTTSGLVGTVEVASTGQRKIVHSREELLEALGTVPPTRVRRARVSAGKR